MISAGATASVGGDDRAEHERGPPVEPDRLVGDDRDRRHGHEDERDREQRDRLGVSPQVAHGGEERGPVQERWEEDQEHEIRVELHGGNAGQEADHGAPHHQRHRVGHTDQARDHGEAGDGQEQPEDDQLDVLHDRRVAASPGCLA
jgi:hypothetical protein